MKARKKPVIIDFCIWTGQNHREMYNFLGGDPDEYMTSSSAHFYILHSKGEGGLVIRTSEGDMFATIGDHIIKEPFDKERMYYPCKAEIFYKTYDVLLDKNYYNNNFVSDKYCWNCLLSEEENASASQKFYSAKQ